ncbi:glyoxalase [Rhizobium sp. Leaf384]|uniref:VOC family protein n=1 Tax=unclassified Rhizobium TaxID=2613769 RepID=UPI0007149164|nr:MULTISPECIES: VOC family protein [unclassified Rhizobium]KQS75347.1 glyoxalase [Rhizobium sp. Leaf383]KQS78736.1 glyoxalase [Rhizobium sp. Leaf384]
MNLSYVNVFTKDIVSLSGFYRDLFGFEEIPEIRSPIFVGLTTGQSCLGFNAQDAYDLLGLGEFSGPTGIKFLLNIDVDQPEDVDRLVPVAVSMGARLIKPPYKTYYNWYQAVLLDPEGNVFRINKML